MNDLLRELAPVSEMAWEAIEYEAKRTLKTSLAARKLVDFSGPHGWEHGAENVGRVQKLDETLERGVEARTRVVQPLVELRAPFELPREELEAVGRGAKDHDLKPLIEAARGIAHAEDRGVFYGFAAAGIRGIMKDSPHRPIPLSEDYTAYPRVVSEAIEVLREAGIDGPYGLALGPVSYNGLFKTAGAGGYPVIQHVRRFFEGPIVWAPALDGAVVLSLRGGDFQLVVGRDFSIGYLAHDAHKVRLYLEESVTFRLLTPEAAVPLVMGNGKRRAAA